MHLWKRALLLAAPAVAVAVALAATSSSGHADDAADDEALFPLEEHYLLPPPSPILADPSRDIENERVAYGLVGDEVLEQPILYSHRLHAGRLQIECEYCHFNARKSRHAGVPPTGTCMGCHQLVPTDGRSERAQADLALLKEYHEKGEPIPWVKVHDLPDFVYFTHKRHVKAGVACQECHGEVQDDMTVAYRTAELTMGWCLNCHKDHPSVDENYGAQAELRRAEMKDCWTCHQ